MEYTHIAVNHEQLVDRGQNRDVVEFLDFPDTHRMYANTWVGMDVGYCVDEKTEIFTRRGWLKHNEVVAGYDESLAINPETGMSEWQPITEVYRELFTGIPMVAMEGQSFSALTTPHHRWLTRAEGGRAWRWRETRTLTTKDRIPLSVPRGDSPEVTSVEDAFVELVAWYFTEGSYQPKGQVELSQSILRHPGYVKRIHACLEELFGEPGAVRRGPYRPDIGPLWSVAERFDGTMAYFHLSKPIADRLHYAAPGKRPSVEWLSSLTQVQLELFLDVCQMGDGWIDDGGVKFEQHDKGRIRAFEAACVLAGKGVSTSYDAVRERWHTAILRSDTVGPVKSASFPRLTRQAMTITPVTYDGMIWCPTLKHHNWLARRNGSVYFTGNTNHPSEIMVFGEVPVKDKVTRLKLLTRIHLERISNPQQVRAICWVMDFYKPKAFGMDKTGVGLPLFQDLQGTSPTVAAMIRGYNFSEKILVDFDEGALALMKKEGDDDVKEAEITKSLAESSMDLRRKLVDRWQLSRRFAREPGLAKPSFRGAAFKRGDRGRARRASRYIDAGDVTPEKLHRCRYHEGVVARQTPKPTNQGRHRPALSRDHPTAAAFVDESGAISCDRFFAVGILKCEEPSRLLRAVQKFRDRKHWYAEIKFSEVKGASLGLMKELADVCLAPPHGEFFCFVADRQQADPIDRFGTAWTAYAKLAEQLLVASLHPDELVSVMADNYSTPDHVLFEEDLRAAVNKRVGRLAIVSVCRLDSRSSDGLQVADLLTSAIAFEFRAAAGLASPRNHKAQLAQHIRDRLGAPSCLAGWRNGHHSVAIYEHGYWSPEGQ